MTRNIFMTMLGLGIFFCSLQAQSQEKTETPAFQTYVFECQPDGGFIVNYRNGKAWVFLPMRTVALEPVPSDVGSKYGNHDIVYWYKDGRATLTTPKEYYDGCKNNRVKAVWEDAKLRGVDFRATGNEPGWHLEISGKNKALFVWDYGQHRQNFILAPPITNNNSRSTSYRAIDTKDNLIIFIDSSVCRDTASGAVFKATVRVEFAGREFRGCGKAMH